jgi:hypothetical protein
MSVLKLNQIQTANGVIMANLNSSGANVGIQLASNLAPAFSAYKSSNQTLAYGTESKVTFDTESFDTNSNFSSSRFTPTVAGYYQVNILLTYQVTGSRQYSYIAKLYKNGSQILAPENTASQGASCDRLLSVINTVVYMNGTSDYLEVYAVQYDFTSSGSIAITSGAASGSQFSASLVRSA